MIHRALEEVNADYETHLLEYGPQMKSEECLAINPMGEVPAISHDFVCGSRFTMADVYVGAHVDWGLEFKSLPVLKPFEDYAARVRERSAYKEGRRKGMELVKKVQNKPMPV